MKYCPTCQTEYDEEIIRFCTKDGTPLIDEDAPDFTEMPSETSEEIETDDEVQTVISRKSPTSSETANLSTADVPDADKEDSQRIVISTKQDRVKEQNVRPKRTVPPPPPKKSNTAVVVLLTIFGTLAIIIGTIVVYSLLTSDNDGNINENININTDVNENPDDNFNADDLLDNDNTDEDLNLNMNIDENLSTKTPTPTPTATRTPTPTPDENTNTNVNANVSQPNTNAATTPTPATPRPTVTATPVLPPPPPPPPPPANTNRPVNVGTINGRAISLPTPAYPTEARQVKASGRVMVNVTVDESGNVVAAKATGGHPLLRRSAENAALRSRFKPVSVNGTPRKAVGTVVYNFVN